MCQKLLLLIYQKVIIVGKILFNLLVVGVSVAAIQSASAVKGNTNVFEARDLNTQVKRIPTAPIKKTRLPAAERMVKNSCNHFIMRGINPWMIDPSGIVLSQQRELKYTPALECLIHQAEEAFYELERQEEH